MPLQRSSSESDQLSAPWWRDGGEAERRHVAKSREESVSFFDAVLSRVSSDSSHNADGGVREYTVAGEAANSIVSSSSLFSDGAKPMCNVPVALECSRSSELHATTQKSSARSSSTPNDRSTWSSPNLCLSQSCGRCVVFGGSPLSSTPASPPKTSIKPTMLAMDFWER